jgi:DNA-binding NtrC family response regulator
MTAKFLPHFPDAGYKPLPDQTISRHRILVVEEEHDLRQITAEVLIDAGYRVDVAEDGTTAWAALQLYQYGLLITDQFIPKMSGFELLKKIDAAHLTLPTIMATGSLPIQEFAAHPFLRSVKLVFKPYSFEKLLSMVALALPEPARASDARRRLPRLSEATCQLIGSAMERCIFKLNELPNRLRSQKADAGN